MMGDGRGVWFSIGGWRAEVAEVEFDVEAGDGKEIKNKRANKENKRELVTQ